MGTYYQLTQEQRYQIAALLETGHQQKDIASVVGVHSSTLSRELRRNRQADGSYDPIAADWTARQRRHLAHKTLRITGQQWAQVERKLRLQWSPEQISGWMRRHEVQISHERIYQYVAVDRRRGGTLYRHLRRGGRRKRPYGTIEKRGKILPGTSIDDRPAIVNDRGRIGDWEIDTVCSKGGQSVVITLVDRQTRYLLTRKVSRRAAAEVCGATVHLLRRHRQRTYSITADNGKEFSRHKWLGDQLKAEIYFAHPYHAWERGTNENMNGLLRQYFPKGTNFDLVSEEDIRLATRRLNHRPRKVLGYRSPHEVFVLGKPPG